MAETPIQFRIAFSGTGTGSAASSNPIGLAGASPGPTLYVGLPFDTPGPFTVDFTAIADPGSVFVGWTAFNDVPFPPAILPGASLNNPETFTHDNVDVTYTITAQFDLSPCYLLTPCPTNVEQTPVIVTNDLLAYLDQVIQILGQCFTVTVAETCTGAVTLNNPVITTFIDCCECNPPTCYELEDCSLQTPLLTYSFLAPGPGVDLSQYAGQVIKICDFSSVLTLLGDQHVIHTCPPFPPADLGFITQITGSTTGFYYDEITSNILPYVAGAAPIIPYEVGMGACFIPPTGIPSTTTNAPRWSIQFFLGSTAITSIIPYDTYMSLGFLQYMVDANTLDPNVTITLNFGPTGLVATFQTYNNVDAETFTGVMYTNNNSVVPQTVVEDLIGSCICYNVTAIGACCNPTPAVFTGIIDSAWPDCICCDPPPDEEPEPYVPTIPEIDKHTYNIAESQCDIDANKTFANAMYDIFKTEAYGMESCCPRNFDQIWIQKELSDLSKINC